MHSEGDVIHLKNIVTELSDNYTKQTLANVFQVPDKMPEYVFDDFIMSPNGFFSKELDRILKNNPDADEDDIAFEFEDWVDINWRLKVLKLNLSDFTKDNQKTMIQRKFGDANPDGIPDEERRVKYQREKARELKPGKNLSVIMLNKGNEYRLLEGWHRTMAILSLGDNGEKDPTKWKPIKIKAWVGTSSSIKRVW